MNMEVIQKIKGINKNYLYNHVKVHYNNALSERYSKRIYSIYNEHNRQIGHCVNAKLVVVKFEINQELKRKCIETGEINLHAYALGYLIDFNDENLEEIKSKYIKLKYDPFSCSGFHFEKTKKEIKKAKKLILNQLGFFIS